MGPRGAITYALGMERLRVATVLAQEGIVSKAASQPHKRACVQALCAREDSNIHGPSGSQAPQFCSAHVDGSSSVQNVQIARFSGRIGPPGRDGCATARGASCRLEAPLRTLHGCFLPACVRGDCHRSVLRLLVASRYKHRGCPLPCLGRRVVVLRVSSPQAPDGPNVGLSQPEATAEAVTPPAMISTVRPLANTRRGARIVSLCRVR